MPDTSVDSTLDALVIGAGITGIHQLHRLREVGLNARILEAGGGVGGTWYWNRYPGCRFDSESYTYGYFFSEELRDEWSWTEEFASQPETERYLNFAVDRLGLREHIELNARVKSAHFDSAAGEWVVATENGLTRRARFLISAVGILSAPVYPNIPGIESFDGEWHHTGLWPDREVSFAGKRVAVIGTGSSGVQIIPIIARDAAQLTVFQRTGNWCTPLNNQPISEEKMQWVREHFEDLHETCMSTPGGFKHRPRADSALEVSEEERLAWWEQLYERPGLTVLLNNFRDISTNPEVNRQLTAFIQQKITERVKDPEVARKLIPDDHTFGMKRPPLENRYFEVFNQSNVELVSIREEPIVEFTESGIRTGEREFDVDLIVFATGFEAATGSIVRMDIRGERQQSLAEYWADGPRTHLGLQTAGFPNLFFVGGPQSTTGNIPRSTESQVEFVIQLISRVLEGGYERVETVAAAEDAWIKTVAETIKGTVLEHAKSWAFGSNIEGKAHVYRLWAGGIPAYVERCNEAFADNYRDFVFR